MPEFRRSHRSNRSSFSFVFKNLVIIVFLCAALLFVFRSNMNLDGPRETDNSGDIYYPDEKNPEDRFFIPVNDRRFLPASCSGHVHHRNYYSICYSEAHEQSLWVSYCLEKKSIQVPNVERTDWYMEDGSIITGSAVYHDYSGSDYSRGHLAPAGDMAFNKLAMEESFLMSNMSPQLRNFNGGIWNELELSVRDWAYQKNKIYVVTGPLFFDDDFSTIGKNQVAVPNAFFKAILDPNANESIGFILPHAVSDLPLEDFAMSIDELEDELGIELFENMYKSTKDQNITESEFDLDKWTFDSKRYRKRITEWNKR